MSFSWNATNLDSKTLVFIDANIEGYQYLASGVLDKVEVRILDPEQNGIFAVTTELQKFAAISGAIDAVHIFSHGNPGEVQLGSSSLNSQTLEEYKSWLQQWQSCLGDRADLLIYGCNVAAGEGVGFVQRLSKLTGANVAASVDLTGNSAKGGNWELEAKTGEIKATAVLKPEVMASYGGVLQIRTVTSATDDDNPGSLRNAIAQANSGDTIVFDSSLANQTITLTKGEIRINPGKNITIDGANAANLTISGNNASRIFLVDANVVTSTNATIKNLKLVNGYVNANTGAGPTNESTKGRGGAIAGADEATITVENVEFNNNVADLGGGAIYTAWNSNLTVNNSKFKANQAIAGNDERGAGAIAFVSPGNLTIRNSDFEDNRGIVGGAINSLNGKLTVENSRFINNDTESAVFAANDPTDPFLRGYGGAIYTDRASSTVEENQGIGGTIRITGSLFENNRAKAGGGANYVFTSPTDRVIIEDSTYINNRASALPGGQDGGKGGGLYQISNQPNRGLTISNTTFANNTAAEQGGGVWLYNAPATITNSTFTGNRAELGNFAGNGGAMAILGFANTTNNIVNTTIANNFANGIGGGVFAGDPQVNVKNTIFADNTVGNQFGSLPQATRKLTDQGGNIQWPPTDITNHWVTDNITFGDPKLGELQEINGKQVLPLLPGSAAIDQGNNSGAPSTDQRGVTRPIDGDANGSAIVDSGAYEFSGNVSTLAPEIEVLDNATNILDGTTTPIDFGTTTSGNSVVKTFTINNTGNDVLSLSTPTLPTGFTLIGDFPTSVAASSTANFQLQLDATAVGNPSGTISFANNDSDENPFDFAIAGVVNPVPAPEIEVLDNATNILDGTTTPIDFGTTTSGNSVVKTFTINNTGNDVLSLSTPTLPTGFTLIGDFPTSVAASSTANFQLQLDATAVGNPSGTISFANNDSDENPFDFAIAGVVNPVPAPEIAVKDGTTDILDGTTTPIDFGTTTSGNSVVKTFTINNTGNDVLSLSTPTLPTGFTLIGDFPTSVAASSTANFQLQLDATAVGNPSGTISFANNDSDENPFDFAIAGVVNPPLAPEIAVKDGTTDILDGTTTPIDFGTTTSGNSVVKTFTINNTGNDVLSLSTPTLPTGFTLIGDFPTSVAASSTANFQLQLDATAVGNPSGTISFANNDSDENPFDFAIAGVVNPPLAPEIEVLDNATNIVDGTTTPIDFGTTTSGNSVVKTFTINNTGNDVLSLSTPTLPTGFTLIGDFPTSVAASSTANFQLQLDATATGNPSGTISFANNDSDENPFDFAIAGVVNPVPAPEIEVLDNATNILDGTTTPIDFGTTTSGNSVVKTFTINNTGNDVLSLSTPTLPTGFTLIGDFPTSVAASSTANFQLQLDATAVGNPSGTISFANNDSDENPFDFAIAGVVNPVPAPEIAVKDGTTDILDGTTTPIDFGTTTSGNSVVKTFTINNTGNDVLSLSTPTLPTGFTLIGDFPTSVAASSTANFQLQLDATAVGNPSGTISFANNDSDENPFDFAIAGVVNPVPAPEIEVLDNATNIVDGTTTPIDFGTTTSGNSVVKTFTINNTGNDVLSLSTPTLPTGFTLIGDFPTSVAASSTANFQLQLDATATGNPSGTISFANNDSDENPFDFAIAGVVNPVPNPRPTITNVTSTAPNGKFTVGQVIPINITFSENVFVNCTPQLVLETGALDAVVNFSSGSGTNTLTFNYKVGLTDATADLDYLSRTALNLNNGTIEDADGNNAVLTLPTPGTTGSLSANKAIEIPAFNIIAGTNRRDNLTGTNLSDRLIGEQGNDILTGGGGADEFVYKRIQDRADTITDFQPGIDKIVMTNLLASFNYSGSNPIADGIISFSSRGRNTVLLLDPDGADGSALARSYITFRNVSVADLNNPNNNNFVFS